MLIFELIWVNNVAWFVFAWFVYYLYGLILLLVIDFVYLVVWYLCLRCFVDFTGCFVEVCCNWLFVYLLVVVVLLFGFYLETHDALFSLLLVFCFAVWFCFLSCCLLLFVLVLAIGAAFWVCVCLLLMC